MWQNERGDFTTSETRLSSLANGSQQILENMVADVQTSQKKKLESEYIDVKFNTKTTGPVCKS